VKTLNYEDRCKQLLALTGNLLEKAAEYYQDIERIRKTLEHLLRYPNEEMLLQTIDQIGKILQAVEPQKKRKIGFDLPPKGPQPS
jgi:hypothetical protein